MLLLFIVILFLLWIIVLTISKDIFSPASIFCVMFLFAAVCAMYSENTWGFVMSQEAFWILLVGIGSFVGVSLLYYINTNKHEKKYKTVYSHDETRVVTPILFRGIRATIVCGLFFVVFTIYMFYLLKLTGGTSLLDIASVFRNSSRAGDIEMPFVGRLCSYLMRAIAISQLYIIINNYFAKAFRKNSGLLLCICVLLYILSTLLSGERTSMIRTVGYAILAVSILRYRYNPLKQLSSIKAIARSGVLLILLLYAFAQIRYFVGRSSQLNFVDYICFYAGGPLFNFCYFVDRFTKPDWIGDSTFLGIYNNFARLGFGTVASVHRENVILQSRGIFMGNVYTIFYDYYQDFGILGVVVLTALYAAIINKLYINAKYLTRRNSFKVMLYMFVTVTLFFAGFTEQFYSSLISIASFEIIVMFWVLSALVTSSGNWKLRLRE